MAESSKVEPMPIDLDMNDRDPNELNTFVKVGSGFTIWFDLIWFTSSLLLLDVH